MVNRAHSVTRFSLSRSVALLALVAVLVSGALIDQRASTPRDARATVPIGAAPASATSSAWYCPMVFATKADPTAGAITILNPTSTLLTGTATVSPTVGAAVNMAINVPARSRITLNPGTVVNASFAAVLVRLMGGGAAVEQFAHTGQGDQSTPCASSVSDNWYFADGTTESGASLQLALFNPFSEDAITDTSFVTSDGPTQPQAFQGVVVPAHGVVVLDVSGQVRRRAWLATSVSVRSGRVAATEMQSGVIDGVAGLGYTLGTAAPSMNQYVADMVVAAGRNEALSIYNPNDDESEVQVSINLDKGTAAPYDLHVPANGRVQLAFGGEARIPKDTRFSATVNVTNNQPVVSQVTTTAAAPAATVGVSFSQPALVGANNWLVAAAATQPQSDEYVYVYNPSPDQTAHVQLTITGDGNAATQAPVAIPIGGRYAFHLNTLSPLASASATVKSDQPVVVSREIDVSPGPNLAKAPAIALR